MNLATKTASVALAVAVFSALGIAPGVAATTGTKTPTPTTNTRVIVGCHGLPKKIKQTHFHLSHKKVPLHIVCAAGTRLTPVAAK